MKIAWAKDPLNECGHQWKATPGETITYREEGSDELIIVAAQGGHRCVKDAGHESDITNDDHQCCCGNSTWVP